MKTQGVSFRHAVEILEKDSPSLAAEVVPVKRSTQRKLESLPLDQNGQALLNQVVDYYHKTLLQSLEALAYLDKLGLGDRALIEQFKLGFDNRTLAYRLPESSIKPVSCCDGQLIDNLGHPSNLGNLRHPYIC